MVADQRERQFQGARLRTARLFRSMTQANVAEGVGIRVPYVSQLEAGLRSPTANIANALAAVLQFDPEFFYGPPLDEFRREECHFRSPKTTPESLQNRVLSYGSLLNLLVAYLEETLDLPGNDVPEIRTSSDEEIERAAESCRMRWGLGLDTPLSNTIRIAENAGVLVVRLPQDTAKVDAFSRCASRSTIILNEGRGCATRWRFDVGHELGHLVMHGGMETGIEEREREADRFSSAFLLPRAGFVRDFPRGRPWDWDAMLQLKARWRTSLQAMMRRALDLQLVDAADYTRGYKAISAKGWLKNEPGEPMVEEPELLALSLKTVLEEDGTTAYDIADQLKLPLDAIERLTGQKLEGRGPPAPPPSLAPVFDLPLFRDRVGRS